MSANEKLGMTVVALISYALYGWMYALYYGWFLVPLGAPKLPWPHIFALCMWLDYITHNTATRDITQDKAYRVRVLSNAVTFPLTGMLLGWILQFFI